MMLQNFLIFLLLIASVFYLINKSILKRGVRNKECCSECGPLKKPLDITSPSDN